MQGHWQSARVDVWRRTRRTRFPGLRSSCRFDGQCASGRVGCAVSSSRLRRRHAGNGSPERRVPCGEPAAVLVCGRCGPFLRRVQAVWLLLVLERVWQRRGLPALPSLPQELATAEMQEAIKDQRSEAERAFGPAELIYVIISSRALAASDFQIIHLSPDCLFVFALSGMISVANDICYSGRLLRGQDA